jgi:hypothetical protein
MARNTNTGGVLESMVLPALKRGKYITQKQVHVGIRLGAKGKHNVDATAEKDQSKFLVSLKWQQTSGTAEQKVPFEVMCLAEVLKEKPEFTRAYVVLGGDGWKLRDFYTSGGLGKYMHDIEGVKVVTLERFIAIANNGKL